MHELDITRDLVAAVDEAARGRRVHRVWLELGEYSAVLPDAMRFCFDLVCKGTALEGAALEIVELRAGWQCLGCGMRLGEPPHERCPHCGSARLASHRGDELNIKAMEVESCA